MGYTTDFWGEITIDPPLNKYEHDYLTKFAETRRMYRSGGPYFVEGAGFMGQDNGPDEIIEYNSPPPGQPGLWCQWVPDQNGTALVWDGGEKFYNAEEWMDYLIDHFLRPNALAKRAKDPQFEQFNFDHVCNGVIYAQGEDPDDRWRLVVDNNEVRSEYPETTWPELPEHLR